MPKVAHMDAELRLGNLDAMRDWGFASDYVQIMWLTHQQRALDDYVVATGETHSVREFVDLPFREFDLNYEDYIVIDPKFFQPAEVNFLQGDAFKAQETLKWSSDV
ncbi:GDP-mannose 4,6-dehydratase [Methanoculleus frigidifontis]|nr:GDP-mannose 4,6-dehydratase [Methanoculleus sp. FWC-SCC1]